ncbi:MAG: 50S ribosomal protein L25 [Candidatus Mycalebacterium zealandia]|nr:MAG: 50S ribosomal protein L25 [Candidatus Mycalebacterium zealandia]
MEKSSLTVKKRERTGKIGVSKVRKDKMIPAVIYGSGIDPVNIEVAHENLKKALATNLERNTLLEIKIENSDVNPALSILKDVHKDPMTGKPKHLDFQSIDPNRSIRVDVPMEFVGKSQGIKDGGILEPLQRFFKIKCLPENIPSRIEVDITELEIGGSLYVRDLNFAEGLEILNNPKDPVVMVIAPRAAISEAATAPTDEHAEAVDGEVKATEEGAEEETEKTPEEGGEKE